MRSTIEMPLHRADLDPCDPDVVALDQSGGVGEHGLVGVRRAEAEVADDDGQDAGGDRGHHHEDDELHQCRRGLGVEGLHRSDTFAPRAIGPTSSTPRSGTSCEGTPSEGPSRLLRRPASAGLPAYPVPRVNCRPVRRSDPVGALAGRGVHAVDEVRLVSHRVGLAPRRVRQVEAVRAAVVAVHRPVGGGVAARLVGQRLEDDVEREAAEGLRLALAAGDQAAQQAGVLRGVAGEQCACGRLTCPSRMMLSPLARRKSWAVSENDVTSAKRVCSCWCRSWSVPVVLIVLRRIWASDGATSA